MGNTYPLNVTMMEKKMMDYLEEQTQTVHVGHITSYRKLEIIFYTKEPEKTEGFISYFLTTIERENSLWPIFDLCPQFVNQAKVTMKPQRE